MPTPVTYVTNCSFTLENSAWSADQINSFLVLRRGLSDDISSAIMLVPDMRVDSPSHKRSVIQCGLLT